MAESASTHAEEGVRGKHRTEPAKEKAELLAREHQRDRDVRNVQSRIDSLADKSSDANTGIVWVGDINPRSINPVTGRADFGRLRDDGKMPYDQLLASREYIGASLDGDGPEPHHICTKYCPLRVALEWGPLLY